MFVYLIMKSEKWGNVNVGLYKIAESLLPESIIVMVVTKCDFLNLTSFYIFVSWHSSNFALKCHYRCTNSSLINCCLIHLCHYFVLASGSPFKMSCVLVTRVYWLPCSRTGSVIYKEFWLLLRKNKSI